MEWKGLGLSALLVNSMIMKTGLMTKGVSD